MSFDISLNIGILVGWATAPKDVPVLIPRTCEYVVALIGKRYFFSAAIKIKVTEMRRLSWIVFVAPV